MPAEEYIQDTEADGGPMPIRNPGKMEFIRVNSDPVYRARVCILNDPRTETIYIVAPNLKNELEGDVAAAELVLAANQDGEHFLWLAKMPAYDNEPFGTTRMAAISQAKTGWTRLRIRTDRKGYDAIQAMDTFADPQWPATSFEEICRDSFADRFISSMDHPVIKRLRGESL
jgi:hypothetical protein